MTMPDTIAWHAHGVDDIVRRLGTSLAGQPSAVVADRRREYGSNALPPPHLPSAWRVFLDQFRSPLVAILMVAVVVAFALREWRDGAVILAVVLVNAVIGFRQEAQSDAAVQRLLQLAAPSAHVLRDGQEHEVPVDDLVVGDIVALDSGDAVPADGRWAVATNVRVNEASLTGEAVPVAKTIEPLPAHAGPSDQRNMAWRGTTVVGGRGQIIVTAVGPATRYGQIVTSMASIRDAGTPFQQQLKVFSARLVVLTLGLGLIVFFLGLGRQLPFESVFLLTVSLIVSVIPEGLPVVMTMAMAWGMWAMAKRRAIVRKLNAVETLGAVTVVATDKTGTLTYGEMMVQQLSVDGRTFSLTGRGYDRSGDIFLDRQAVSAQDEAGLALALRLGALNNDSRFVIAPDGQLRPTGDPTELALIVAAEKGGWTKDRLEAEYPRLGEIPFDARYKHMITWHRQDDHVLGVIKGAPQEVLKHCRSVWTSGGAVALTPSERRRLLALDEQWAGQALRGLAVAVAEWPRSPTLRHPDDIGQTFTYVGLFGLADAIRPEAVEALAEVHRAGVRTIMLTGDHRETGRAIARRVGLLTDADHAAYLDGNDIDRLDDRMLTTRLAGISVATRLTPEHKLRIARLLKQSGDVVAMTGDGINDAPALLEADVGIAVGQGSSDAAKEAADIVLTDGNYASIVAAIAEGRRIYRNIRRALVYLLASNFGELGLIVVTLLLGLPLPLLPTQIIWLNAMTDPFLGVALAREPVSPLVMRERPQDRLAPFISGPTWRRIIVAAATLTVGSLIVFLIGRAAGRTEREVFALTLTTIAFGEWVLGMTVRSSIRSTFAITAPNPSLFVAFAVVGVMQVLILYVPPLSALMSVAPLRLADWALVVLGVLPTFLVEEVQKWRIRRRYTERPLMRPIV